MMMMMMMMIMMIISRKNNAIFFSRFTALTQRYILNGETFVLKITDKHFDDIKYGLHTF